MKAATGRTSRNTKEINMNTVTVGLVEETNLLMNVQIDLVKFMPPQQPQEPA